MQEPYFATSAILSCRDAEKGVRVRVGMGVVAGAAGEPKLECPDVVV